jgi:hypothetical protein
MTGIKKVGSVFRMCEAENELPKPRNVFIFAAAVVCGNVLEIEDFFDRLKKGSAIVVYQRCSGSKLYISEADPRNVKEAKKLE